MLPAGFYNTTAGAAHDGVGRYARFWSSMQGNSYLAYDVFIEYGKVDMPSSYKMVLSSVRCVKD